MRDCAIVRKSAFTLIELLVVIAIIAILAAILFPVFAQAKRAAKQATDISNLKQLITADLMYAPDVDDRLPLVSKAGEEYLSARLMMPYVKTRDIFRSPTLSDSVGTTQKRWGDLLGIPWSNVTNIPKYTTDPNTIGIPSTGTAATYWNDVYPPMDYQTDSKFVEIGDKDAVTGNLYSVNLGNIERVAECARWVNFPGCANDFDTSMARSFSFLTGEMLTAYNETSGANKQGKRDIAFVDGHAKTYSAGVLWPTPNLPTAAGTGKPGNGNWVNWGVSPQFSEDSDVAFGTKG